MQLIEIPKQTPISEMDEVLVDTFIEEVEEMRNEIIKHCQVLTDNPSENAAKRDLKRAFHTLKGSGRLVGATAIAEFGLHFETLANKIIDGNISINEEILTLLKQAAKILPNMIEQLKQDQEPPKDVILLISQAANLAQS